jgi:hypothetical protein
MSNDIPQPKPRKLSEDIDSLLLLAADRPLRLREVISVIQGRAYTLLLILLSLPFCLPVPVPGLSTAFGAVIALIGFRLSLRLEPWLPARILDAEMSSSNVTRLLGASKRVARVLEKLMRPRWTFLVEWRVMNHAYGAMICICGLLLLLPLPIPFSNLLPGLAIIFLSAAILEKDGYFAIAGMLMFALTLFFFAGIFIGGVAAANWLEEWFGGVFDPNDEVPPPNLPLPVPDIHRP